MKSTISLFFLLYCLNFAFSQECIYEEFGINEGLPSSQVYDLYQDPNGILWMATDRGLANYNGYEIKTFDIKDGVLNPVVLDFYPQKNGVVFCATYTGELFYFHEDFTGFFPYTYNHILKEQLTSSQIITNFIIDEDEKVHICCDGMMGKFVISKDGVLLETPYQYDKDEAYELNYSRINDQLFSYQNLKKKQKNATKIKFDIDKSSGNELITLNNQQTFILKDVEKIRILDQQGNVLKTIISDSDPITIKKIDENHFITGYYYKGAVIRDANGNIVKRFLEDKSVSNFLIDHDGSYWFSTLHTGVFYVKEPKIKFWKTNIDAPIWTLTKNKEDLYVGYSSGEVLKKGANDIFSAEQEIKNGEKSFVEYDSIRKQLYVHSGEIFYTRNENNVRVNITDSLLQSYTIKLSEPSEQGILISHNPKLSIIGNDSTSFIKNVGTRIEDAAFWKDEIYIGTTLGVLVYKNDSLQKLNTVHPIFKNRVDDIDVNVTKNEIYFASLGEGIIIYDKNTEEVRTITMENGLSNNIINELYIESKNELWVCTNSGLNKVTFKEDSTFEITGLKSSNGLLNDGIADIEVIDDVVWIASRKGLMSAPKQLFDAKQTTNNYFLSIEACYVNDTITSVAKLKNLSYKENRVTFFVEGISFKSSNELMYKYTMEGLDTKWYFTKNRNISYPSLPYGKYILKVAATTFENDENLNYLEIPIHISAPFWKRAWFIIAVILAVGLLIYAFFRYRILSYNRHIIREILRLIIKKIKRKEKFFTFKEAGKEIRIQTDTILYVKSSGNYIELVTEHKNYTIRKKIGEFIDLMPDPLEYIRVHRSYIIRIDKVAEKNSKEVTINDEKIPVSNSYVAELNKLIF